MAIVKDKPATREEACKQLTRMVGSLANKWTRNHRGDYDDIFNEGMKAVEGGSNPIELYRGMQIGVKDIVDFLVKKVSVNVKTNDAIKNIATISANGDDEIGGIIAEAIHQVGNDGVVTVEEGNSSETTLEIVEGLEFDRGYLSHFFMNNQAKLASILEEP